MRRALLVLALPCALSRTADAHEVRPAYLQLRQISSDTYDVLWKVPARGGAFRLGLDLELPADCESVTRPRGEIAGESSIERWTVRRAGGLTGGRIHVVGLAATLTDVLVRLERLDGTTQVARLTPASPTFVVEAAPRAAQIAITYLRLGVEHILLGIDHLLFVLSLLILVQGTRRLVATVTAFTVAHSITLAGATLGWVSVPGPPVEACIALSILLVAAEIAHGRSGQPGMTARRPWLVAFAFGLLHGFGFAGALSGVGLPQNAIPVALLLFNLGVELGQLLFIAAVLALATAGRALPLPSLGWAWRIPSYAIGTAAAFWMIQRLAGFGD